VLGLRLVRREFGWHANDILGDKITCHNEHQFNQWKCSTSINLMATRYLQLLSWHRSICA